MKIGNVNVKKIKRMLGVDVPEEIQSNPEKALAYIAGYTCEGDDNKSGFSGMSDEIKDIASRIESGSPFVRSGNLMLYVADEFKNAFRWGYAAGGKSYKIPKGGFYKKTPVEHERDLVELTELMRRNPGFIPHYAWPGRDDHKWERSDREFHFG